MATDDYMYTIKILLEPESEKSAPRDFELPL